MRTTISSSVLKTLCFLVASCGLLTGDQNTAAAGSPTIAPDRVGHESRIEAASVVVTRKHIGKGKKLSRNMTSYAIKRGGCPGDVAIQLLPAAVGGPSLKTNAVPWSNKAKGVMSRLTKEVKKGLRKYPKAHIDYGLRYKDNRLRLRPTEIEVYIRFTSEKGKDLDDTRFTVRNKPCTYEVPESPLVDEAGGSRPEITAVGANYRITRVRAVIGKRHIGRGRKLPAGLSAKLRKKTKCTGDFATQIIPAALGGDASPENVFIATESYIEGRWSEIRRFHSDVINNIRRHGAVGIDVSLDYGGNKWRPKAIGYEAWTLDRAKKKQMVAEIELVLPRCGRKSSEADTEIAECRNPTKTELRKAKKYVGKGKRFYGQDRFKGTMDERICGIIKGIRDGKKFSTNSVGRQLAQRARGGGKKYGMLDAKNWSIDANYAFIDTLIDEYPTRAIVLLNMPDNYRGRLRKDTITWSEVQQFDAAGFELTDYDGEMCTQYLCKGSACPDRKDDDGDGIPNYKDQCCDEKEDKNGIKDKDGCPDGKKSSGGKSGKGSSADDDDDDDDRGGICLLHYGDMDFRYCARMSRGKCASWSTKCTPNDRCTFDPNKSLFRKCKGKGPDCTGWTGKCKPQDSCMFNAEENMYQKCRRFSGGECVDFSGRKCVPKKQ